MGILRKVGLKTKGKYCYYRVGKDSAVIVAIKKWVLSDITLPKKIGRLTVRGFTTPFGEGKHTHILRSLPKQMRNKYEGYMRKKFSFTTPYDLTGLPDTIEFLDLAIFNRSYAWHFPKSLRYITSLHDNNRSSITLPGGLLYLGQIYGETLSQLHFDYDTNRTPPVHTLSEYLGREVDETPQLADNALHNCIKLTKLELPNHFVRIGVNALPKWPGRYRFRFPSGLQQAEDNAFAQGMIDTLVYPDSVPEGLRSRHIQVNHIDLLHIRDIGQLEAYTQLLAQGQDPQLFPDKCLYHLIRKAKRISLPDDMLTIFDNMFADCRDLCCISMKKRIHSGYEDWSQLPEGITHIGQNAFKACGKLTTVSLPRALQYIGDRAFLGCCGIRHMYLPASVQHIGTQAFMGCPLEHIQLSKALRHLGDEALGDCKKLRLTDAMLQQLKTVPGAWNTVVRRWAEHVNAAIESGDKRLFRKNVTTGDKQAAYDHYRKAMDLDPFNAGMMQRLNYLLLTTDVPHGISTKELRSLVKYQREQKNECMVAHLESLICQQDAICTILLYPETPLNARLQYPIGGLMQSAVVILEYLLRQIEKHPEISLDARNATAEIIKYLLANTERNANDDLAEEFNALETKAKRILMIGSGGKLQQAELLIPDRFINLGALSGASLLKKCQLVYMQKDELQAWHDGQYWLKLLADFDPYTAIPAALKQWKKPATVTGPQNLTSPFPGFVTPTPEIPYSSPSGTSEWTMSEAESEYWASVVAKNSGGYTVDDLEDDWGDLADMGFWDDTGWM